jgi:hypothetical protein
VRTLGRAFESFCVGLVASLSSEVHTSFSGLGVTGNTIVDLDAETAVSQLITDSPLTSGARSAYGSVALLGTFTSLAFNVTLATSNRDGGSFTLGTVPEPSALVWSVLGSVVLLAIGGRRRWRSCLSTDGLNRGTGS